MVKMQWKCIKVKITRNNAFSLSVAAILIRGHPYISLPSGSDNIKKCSITMSYYIILQVNIGFLIMAVAVLFRHDMKKQNNKFRRDTAKY